MTLRRSFYTSTLSTRSGVGMMACALLLCISCMQPEPVKGTLDTDLEQTRSEMSWGTREGLRWEEIEDQADVAWRRRAQYDQLTRAAVGYEQAEEMVQKDGALDAERRKVLQSRQLLKSAHAYFLIGYVNTPVEGQRTPEKAADARVAYERGAMLAREAMGLALPEATIRAVLQTPTPRLLEQVKDASGLGALYWYAINTHFVTTHFQSRKSVQHRDVAFSLLKYISEQQPNYAQGMVLGTLGVHRARHGRGGGEAEESKRYFEQSVEFSPNNLMNHVMFAEHYAVVTQNALLFDRQIEFVLNAPTDLLQEYEQENRLAVRRASQLQVQRESLFY